MLSSENTKQDIVQKAILVGLNSEQNSSFSMEDAMDELEELVIAAGAEVLLRIVQNKSSIDSATYIGKGKVQELKQAVEDQGANIVIFNHELSGSQIRNIEEAIDVKVIDRTALILDIFALRAQSAIAKMQVELAQLKYRLPRLKGLGESLSRTGAGIGTRGPGEQKLELDRRRIDKRISDLKEKLEQAKQKRDVTRKQRKKSTLPVVALVGYTNAGKSTIMNNFIETFGDGNEDKKVFQKDMLFATLDTYHRKVQIDEHKSFILIDTVGFVSNLPHGLVEAFKATLEEVLEADLLVHVVDAANPHYDLQIAVTEKTLSQIGVKEHLEICVFNKIDLLDEEALDSRADIYMSMKTKENFTTLVNAIDSKIFTQLRNVKMLVPYTEGSDLSTIITLGKVTDTKYLAEGTQIEISLDKIYIEKYSKYIIGE